MLFPKIQSVVDKMDWNSIPDARKKTLQDMATYIQQKLDSGAAPLLNFICTHNSRRSQFAEIWAQTAAYNFGVYVQCFSGGTETTAFHPNALDSLTRLGFEISMEKDGDNPLYRVRYSEKECAAMFSKTYDHEVNPTSDFAAVMTCSHADENCPVVFGADKRISLSYEDPKFYDNTPLADAFYDVRSFEIGTELFYLFSLIQKP
jgi:arsenate reductase